MRRDITDLYLQSLKPPVSGRLEIHDARVNGLMMRVTAAGVSTWSVRHRLANGKRVRPSLGRWPEMSLREARKRAKVLLGIIADGADPVEQKRAARAEAEARRTLPTVAASLSTWQKLRADDWSDRYAREVERLCTKIIEPTLGALSLVETTRTQWMALIIGERKERPGTAAWLYAVVSAYTNFAEAAGWIDHPLLPRRGRAAIAPKAPPRERVLSDEELTAVWRAATSRSAKSRTFVQLLVLTGCRVSEATGIALGEVDPARLSWTIPATRSKNNHALTVPLPSFLVAELLALTPAETVPGYRLLGARRNSPLQAISRVKEAIDAVSGVRDWRLHDLRRTVRTGLARFGVPTSTAEACLNHLSGRSQLERTYNRHSYEEEILSALTRWQEHVAELVRPRLVAA